MFGRLKTALVESFVGAIALGLIFAQAVLHLISAITAPVNEWEQQQFFSELRVGEGEAPRHYDQRSLEWRRRIASLRWASDSSMPSSRK